MSSSVYSFTYIYVYMLILILVISSYPILIIVYSTVFFLKNFPTALLFFIINRHIHILGAKIDMYLQLEIGMNS